VGASGVNGRGHLIADRGPCGKTSVIAARSGTTLVRPEVATPTPSLKLAVKFFD
jgi:hypothetical protein